MKKLSTFLFLVCLLFFILPDLLAQKKIDSLKLKMDVIFKKYNSSARPGCAVAIIRNDSVIFKKGYGMANLEYDISISPTSIFDIASVSKQFAGFAIATLVQEGKIALDDDIHKYLPDVPDFKKTITIRHLVHHTSGLRDWPEALHVAGWRWDEAFTFKDIMRMVKDQKDLDFEPGSRYSYSNTGYNLLAGIVEKVSGQSFRTWTDSTIFKPLGMNSSHFMEDYTEVIKNIAYSYYLQGNNFKKNANALTAYGSSSLFTSVEDLSKWVINFNKAIAAKNPVYLQMLEEGVLNNGNKVHYGYGLANGTNAGLKTISHDGGWASYRTTITNYPDEHISFIILSNAGDFDLGGCSQEVANLLLKPTMKAGEKRVDKVMDSPTVKLNTQLAQKYVGTYQLGPGWAVTLTLENEQLMTQANNEEKVPMQAKSDSTFWIDAYGASMTFVKDASGNVNMFKYKNIQAKRITPWLPDTNQFSQYVGTYYSKELSSEYKVQVVEGKLVMQHFRLGEINIGPDPTNKEQFSSNVGSIKFIKDSKSTVTGFNLSGGRIKNIWFDKIM